MEENNFNENEKNNIIQTNGTLDDKSIEEKNNINNSIEGEKEKIFNKKNKKLLLFVVIILIIIISIVGCIFLKNILDDDDTFDIENDIEETEETENELEEEIANYELKVYKNSNSGYLCKKYDESYCKDLAFTIKTKTENALVLDVADAFVLYEDDGLRVYNNYDGKITKLNLKNVYSNYIFHYNDNKVLGFIYYNEMEVFYYKGGYFSIDKNEKLYDLKYDDIRLVNNTNYLSAINGKNVYLLNTTEEKEEIVANFNSTDYYPGDFHAYCNNDKCFYYISDGDIFNAYKFYSNNKKLIFDKKISEGSWSFKDKYLYVIDDKIVKKYDIDGTLMSTSKVFDDVHGVIENYVVYVENNNLSLMNIDSSKSIVLDKWSDNYRYDNWYHSGVYTRELLDSMGESDKPEGVYVLIYFKEKDSNGNYGIEYCYTSTGEIKTFAVTHPEGGRAKPVLYLYPTETTNVKVEFQNPEYLTTTYPKYNKSWEVTAHPNGDLYDKDNKYYYGLYWDEIRYNEVDFHEGFYVTKDNAIDFLEEKLDYIGLNNRERNEFIMYWLPILENNQQSLVYFELTKERELGNKLIITPKPDSLLRVSIHIKKVNNKVNIKEQKLEKFERFGFSAVEWGGMTY